MWVRIPPRAPIGYTVVRESRVVVVVRSGSIGRVVVDPVEVVDEPVEDVVDHDVVDVDVARGGWVVGAGGAVVRSTAVVAEDGGAVGAAGSGAPAGTVSGSAGAGVPRRGAAGDVGADGAAGAAGADGMGGAVGAGAGGGVTVPDGAVRPGRDTIGSEGAKASSRDRVVRSQLTPSGTSPPM